MSEYEKPEFNYDLIRGCVHQLLWKQYHERHFEDCVQYCALKWLEGNTYIKWTVIDYCRINGIGERGKQTAKTLEHATLFGLESDENETLKENGFLLYDEAIKQHDERENKQDAKSILENFLEPLNLNPEVLGWVLRNYQVSSLKIR